MRWNCFPDDFGTRHRLRIEIPEVGGTATESDLEIPVPADSATTPKVLVISHLAGAIFGQPGVYRVRVSVDGRVVHSIPITIALAHARLRTQQMPRFYATTTIVSLGALFTGMPERMPRQLL